MKENIYVIKADGTRELFDGEKLLNSLRRGGASSKVAESILHDIKDSMVDDITTHEIYTQAFNLLNREGPQVSIRYSLKRAVMDLGPSGFPFEDYVAEIFKQKGFETLTGQIVKGTYVDHEIDIVAWNEEKLIMVEAKFHNQLGVKSDLKVALYVKARFEDLSGATFIFGGKERKLNEGWLVTNTKFTSSAIQYGSHQKNLVMVGWNYPPENNLHDMILEARLHPITCLVSLSGSVKKVLLEQGVVLCRTILENEGLLDTIGLSGEEKQKVIEEIKAL